jgi:plastocyanin
MARKGKKRREARRRKHQDAESVAAPRASTDDVADEETPPAPAETKTKPARQKKKKGGTRVRISPWWFAGVGAIAAVGVFAFLIATSGSSGTTVPRVTAPPDPRVQGLVPVETLPLEAGGSDVDAYFDPTRLTGPAGEAVEIVIENTGSLSHNVTIAGVDGQYDTPDDWVSRPELIEPGDTGNLVFKIDAPGTYAFRCSLHPDLQFGELVLE